LDFYLQATQFHPDLAIHFLVGSLSNPHTCLN
jgi:hypothetical protein